MSGRTSGNASSGHPPSGHRQSGETSSSNSSEEIVYRGRPSRGPPPAPEPPGALPLTGTALAHRPGRSAENAGAGKQGKGSSGNPAGTERKHTTKQSTSAAHPQTDSKRHHEKPGRSTPAADKATTSISFQPGKGININSGGKDVKIQNDKRTLNISFQDAPGTSTGHHGKAKARESSPDSRRDQHR